MLDYYLDLRPLTQVVQSAQSTGLSTVKDLAEIVEAIATVIAIMVAGLWGYLLFIKTRQKYPRANIIHQVVHRKMPPDKVLLHVDVTLCNVGNVLLQLESGGVSILQIVPPPVAVLNSFKKGTSPVKEGEKVVDWPPVGESRVTWVKDEFEIEPGETDQVNFDFFLDPGIETVQVFSFFKNAKKRRREIGWGQTTTHNLKPPAVPAEPLIPEVE